MQSRTGARGGSAILHGSHRFSRTARVWRWAMGFLATAALLPFIAVTLPNTPTASAASPPVARDDVARTDAGTSVNPDVTGNDFDPDGDAFHVVSVATPAHGQATAFSTFVHYVPNPGFSGVETITYTIQDSTGATATGLLTVWVDTAVSSPDAPVANTDFLYVYQGSNVSLTTTELLSNDTDPQHQPLTVVAVSEPGLEGTLAGDPTNGYTYTPSLDPNVVTGIDHQLDYLVTDAAGHVSQGAVQIRILAAGDPNQ